MTKQKWCGAIAICCVSLSGIPFAHAEWGEWIMGLDARYVDHNNINYSAFSSDRLSDHTVVPSLVFGRYLQLGNVTRLSLTGEVEAGKFGKYDKLDYFQVGATAGLHHKLGLGAEAPWVRGHLSVWSLNVDSDMRDSTIYETGVQIGKRFSPQFDGHMGLTYRSRNGNSGPVVMPAFSTEVFDQKNVTLSAVGSYLLTEQAVLTFGYAFRNGDFDSSCTGANVTSVLAAEGAYVKALAFDDAYWLTRCAYKLEGKTRVYTLGLNYALGPNASLRVGVERQDGKGDVLSYADTIARLGFVYRR